MPILTRLPTWLAAVLVLAVPASAQLPDVAVPEPLEPWVPWVLDLHPDAGCPWVDGRRLCAWPGRLALDLDGDGGTFRLDVVVDRELELGLPGDAARWPREVTADGRAALLVRQGDTPSVRLGAGRHRIEGRFRWSRLPESLEVPAAIALVDLTIGGKAVRFPRRETDGTLWLADAGADTDDEDRLTLEVHRRLDDGVPVLLTTRLVLRVTGSSRAVDLGAPLPEGFVLVDLEGGLPLRFTAEEHVVVQARPGTWEVALRARSLEPVTSLTTVARPEPWPDSELWVFDAAPAVRSARLSGVAAVDPQRTTLPEDWKSLPTYRLEPGSVLTLDVLRRGVPEPPPDAVRVWRVLWLEQAGDRFTVRDRITGDLNQGGRLEALAPGELGRFQLDRAEVPDQLVTLGPDGAAGVEVRGANLWAIAELAYPRGELPAVGWDRDVQELSAELRLPPGWTLLMALGVDRADGALLERWTLLDLFFLLVVSLATWRLGGRRAGVLALVFLALAWQEPSATGLWIWWLLTLPLTALVRARPDGRTARVARRLRAVLLLGFAVQAAVFCGVQWRTGLFPELEVTPGPLAALSGDRTQALAYPESDGVSFEDVAFSVPKPSVEKKVTPGSFRRARQVDAEAVVQTGAGVPTWKWQGVQLSWSGPVTSGQRMRFVLVPPGVELVLSLLRILGAVLVALHLFRLRPFAAAPATAVAVSVLAVFLLALPRPAAAQVAPPVPEEEPAPAEPAEKGLLDELEERLLAPPSCHPACVEVPRLEIRAEGGRLVLTAEVHAAAASAWKLPGPAAVWMPARVTVDGEDAAALRLGDDGFFLLRHDPGVHRVELAGPARDSVALQLPLRPRVLAWRGDGWAIDGFRPDEPPPGTVRLDRRLERTAVPGEGGDAVAPEPWLELRRELDVGLPWLVHTELVRRGPPGTAVVARVPLLSGEAVVTAGIPVEDGEAIVRLEPEESVRRLDSTLEETASLVLEAPSDRPWTETWTLRCSPIWHCQASGLAPTRHRAEDVWLPRWQPWPGERLELAFSRPEPAPGQVMTIDRARFEVQPGRRLTEAVLELDLRLSRGGEQSLRLPPGAELRSFTVDGEPRPADVREDEDGGLLVFTLEPGGREVRLELRQEEGTGLAWRVPEIGLGREAVNVTVRVRMPDNRWLLWTGGPGWGPVVQLWQNLFVIAFLAFALGRFGRTPLSVLDWFLLGAGLTQAPLPAAVVVVLWLLVLGRRERLQPRRFWTYDALQLALAALGVAAAFSLYLAVHTGLLFRPDVQVAGPSSYGSTLTWYVDRVASTLPRPNVLSLPLWVWRLLMLAWSLWLASRLLRWVPWCWRKLSAGPALVGPKGWKAWREASAGAEAEPDQRPSS